MPNEVICKTANNTVRMNLVWGNAATQQNPTVALGSWVIRAAPDDNQSDWDLTGPCWVLDRADINKLIRTLRRARDQAYGADA